MKTILIVDDEQTILDIAQAILHKHTYNCITANSAERASAIIKSENLDMAILDVVLPERGGLDLLMEIKASKPHLPTILMTGKVQIDNDAFVQLAKQFGARHILSKPLTPEQLVAIVKTTIGDKHLP